MNHYVIKDNELITLFEGNKEYDFFKHEDKMNQIISACTEGDYEEIIVLNKDLKNEDNNDLSFIDTIDELRERNNPIRETERMPIFLDYIEDDEEFVYVSHLENIHNGYIRHVEDDNYSYCYHVFIATKKEFLDFLNKEHDIAIDYTNAFNIDSDDNIDFVTTGNSIIKPLKMNFRIRNVTEEELHMPVSIDFILSKTSCYYKP